VRVILTAGHDLEVQVDDDVPGYPGGDVLDDLCARALNLFRLALGTARTPSVDEP
jgi:hypothetical protein